MAKFCSKCGNELKEGARFCSVCGNPVKQVQSAQSAATAAGTNEERQGVFSQQQGFTAQDMQYQQMAGSAAPVKKNKNLWLLAIPAAILVILLVIFGIKAVLSPAYLKPVKYMEKAFNKQDIDLMKKAVPDEYAEWMTDDIVDYMFDLDSDYKITIKVTDKEKIAKKDLEETLIDDYYVLDSIAEDAKAGYILEAEATLKQDGEKDTQEYYTCSGQSRWKMGDCLRIIKIMKRKTRTKVMQEQTKENKLPVVLLTVIIVVLLVGSIVIGILGGGGKKVETAVQKKDIKAAREAAELSDEGEVQTIAIDKDIIVNAGGTGSADEKSEMQDSQTTEDSQTVQNTEDYIFPNSSSVLLTDAEVSGISKDQLRIGRNEILARHGRRFNDQALQQYFDSKSWYNGTISPDEFDANLDSRLNDVERANIEIIKRYE